MNIKNKQPNWVFYLAWILLTTSAIPLAFAGSIIILKGITHWVGDWIYVGGRRHITEDYLLSFVFVPLICLITSGLQYSLLRRYLPKMAWWFLATAVGWLLLIPPLYAVNWALNQAQLTNIPPASILFLIGFCLGFSQWVLLRRRLPRAGWWILASVIGWGLIGPLVGQPFTNLLEISSIGFLPAIATAACWWFLFRQKSEQTPELAMN